MEEEKKRAATTRDDATTKNKYKGKAVADKQASWTRDEKSTVGVEKGQSKSQLTKRFLKKEHPSLKNSRDTDSSQEARKSSKKTKEALQREAFKKARRRKFQRAVYQKAREDADSVFSDDEILGNLVDARRKIRQANYYMSEGNDLAKKAGRLTLKTGKATTKQVYGIGNRTANLMRGRGFTRTAIGNRLESKLGYRWQKMRMRISRSKVGKASRTVSQVTNSIVRPFLRIVRNPLSVTAYFLSFLIFFIIAIVTAGSSSPSTVQQDTFRLNKAWIHFSKLDRENSDDDAKGVGAQFYTPIDDVLFYTNYKFEDYDLKDNWKLFKNFEKMQEELWQDLNGDTDDLKKIADLYSKDSKFKNWKLDKGELEEFQELVEASNETGKFISYQELENPFPQKEGSEDVDTLLIEKRFGYETKDRLYEGTILQADKGQELVAPLAGTIEIKDGDDVLIKTKDTIFTFKDVGRIRPKSGDSIKVGDSIGEVASEKNQEIFYQKLEAKSGEKDSDGKIVSKDKWTYVNLGFYFQKVRYLQETIVVRLEALGGDVASKSVAIYNYLKKIEPKVTKVGVAAMLGNFMVESNIEPKRAEGDYLNPPVGASANSWDDEAWLAIGGTAIYGGAYPNILRRGLGLGQWTDTADGSVRHTLLLDYAKQKKKKWYDLELQIDFIFNGDNPYYQSQAREVLTSNADVNTLTMQFLINWEGNSGNKLGERQSAAQTIYTYLENPGLVLGLTAAGGGTVASSFDFPAEYTGKLKYGQPTTASLTTQAYGASYPAGQCTWYVYNRLVETKIISPDPRYSYLGNGQDWVASLVGQGWKSSQTPQVGAVVSVLGGFDYTLPEYGHVAFVEHVNSDGSFLVSECNFNGVQDRVHYRVCQPAGYYTFAVAP